MLAAALAYTAVGLPVFPLKPRAKVPATIDGLKSATANAEQVAEWWQRWPHANVAIRTGAESGLVVLDVDVQHGGAGALQRLEAERGKLPATAETLTGGGGKHLLFRHPGGQVRNSAGRLGAGLDLRGDGGYIVAPPSVHENGRAYKWIRPLDRGLADPPAWLLQAAETRRNGAAPPVESVIPQGSRRQELLSLAGSMRRRGMDSVELLAALRTVNERRCRPPLPEAEVEALARDVASRYRPDSTPKNSFSPPIALEAGGNEKDPSGIAPVSLRSLLENVPPEPAWIWRGYVAPFALSLLAGRPKVGKSTFLFALLARLVVGEPFLGFETAPAGVLLLSEERRDTLAEKARILGVNSFPPPRSPSGGKKTKRVDVLLRADSGGLPWPELVRQAMTHCHSHDLSVLLVDTWDRWTSLRGDSENAAGAVNEALEPLQYAAASGLAVVIVSHQRKSVGEFGEAVRGSNALTGGVDVVAELERARPSLSLSARARALRAISRFSSTPDELFVELDDDQGVFTLIEHPEEVKAAVERERVLEAVVAFEDASADKIAEEVELPQATVRRHLGALRDKGHLVREGKGKRGDPFRWRVSDEGEAA